eukprot:5867006-Pyramimonas_sp.AAC.1
MGCLHTWVGEHFNTSCCSSWRRERGEDWGGTMGTYGLHGSHSQTVFDTSRHVSLGLPVHGDTK